MGVCRICNKKTPGQFCCPAHSNLWFEINYPDHKCKACGVQLYPDGRSLKEYLKAKFCCNKHKNISPELWLKEQSITYTPKSGETVLKQYEQNCDVFAIVKDETNKVIIYLQDGYDWMKINSYFKNKEDAVNFILKGLWI